MATIKDVARMAGVSQSTVSKYINGGQVRPANLESIRQAIAALDYRVNPFARSLKTQRSHSVGILLPTLSVPFYSQIFTALDKVSPREGLPHHHLLLLLRPRAGAGLFQLSRQHRGGRPDLSARKPHRR